MASNGISRTHNHLKNKTEVTQQRAARLSVKSIVGNNNIKDRTYQLNETDNTTKRKPINLIF